MVNGAAALVFIVGVFGATYVGNDPLMEMSERIKVSLAGLAFFSPFLVLLLVMAITGKQ
jgi:hypothetical protein